VEYENKIPLLCSVVCSQDEDSDRSQAMASALATFFRHIGYTGFKNNHVLDRCPCFNAKDRKIFKFSKGTKKVQRVCCMLSDRSCIWQSILYRLLVIARKADIYNLVS